jgi:hypothetical protein
MRKVLPVIVEDAAILKQRLPRERNGRKKPRLQMLYFLASRQAQTRQDVARLLGVHRHTIGHWLAIYETGGLEALLAPRLCWPRLHRPSRSRRGLPPMKRYANGSSRPITWRFTITGSTRSSVPGSGLSARCRGRATQKTP